MKISVIIPVFNDEEGVINTLKSLMWQDNKNWEAVVVELPNNNIDKLVAFKEGYDNDNKITLVKKDTIGKLNAIITGVKYTTGDIYWILNSGDILYEENVFTKIADKFIDNGIDALMYNISKINDEGENLGIDYIEPFVNNKNLFANTILNDGKNLYTNSAIFRKEVFMSSVYNNYLIWGFPFFMDIKKGDILNVEKVDFSVVKEKIKEENKIENVINDLMLINELLNEYSIPFYNFQKYLFKIFKIKYKVKYSKSKTKNKYKIIKNIIENNLTLEEINSNYYLSTILKFYKNYNSKIVNSIYIENVKNIEYYGKDIVKFIEDMNLVEINEIYQKILGGMDYGFNEIIVNSEGEMENMQSILKFLCISGSVNVRVQ